MANNQQPQGGNSMAALLGNMGRGQGLAGQLQPQANYGGGMQAPMQAWGAGQQQPQQGGLGAAGPPGGAGYPQMSPAAMQNMMGQLSAQQPQQGAGMGAPGPRPMPSFGAPGGGGAAGKGAAAQNPQLKQAIAQLPGAPPMGRPGMMGGPMGPVRRRQPGQGMMPQNPQMRR
jgi:hypothetical protein